MVLLWVSHFTLNPYFLIHKGNNLCAGRQIFTIGVGVAWAMVCVIYLVTSTVALGKIQYLIQVKNSTLPLESEKETNSMTSDSQGIRRFLGEFVP